MVSAKRVGKNLAAGFAIGLGTMAIATGFGVDLHTVKPIDPLIMAIGIGSVSAGLWLFC